MLEENQKHHWLKILSIVLLSFIASFLAFYIVMGIMLDRMTNPVYNAKKIEKMILKDQKAIHNIERKMESPFEPQMRPTIVNLVRENNEYKVIVDLKPFDGDEKGININYEDNILSIKGEIDKKSLINEKIINFK